MTYWILFLFVALVSGLRAARRERPMPPLGLIGAGLAVTVVLYSFVWV